MYIRRSMFLGFCLILICLLLTASCKSGTPTSLVLNPEGTLVDYNGCKTFGSSNTASAVFSSSDSNKECIEYEYGGNVLWLQHINAAFNCCLDGIVGNVEVDGDIIRIEATGILSNGQGCLCDCLYDLNYEIKNLEPIVYLLIIRSITNPIKIDLRKSGSNTYCENRTRYPWN